MHRYTFLMVLFSFLILALGVHAAEDMNSNSGLESTGVHRWMGHDFAFCFVTDDGRTSNLAWADTAQVMGFRFTIAVNHGKDADFALSGQETHDLVENGFEIGSHSLTHGFAGLSESCAAPPRGSMMGYFLCEDLDPVEAMQYFKAEIERDSLIAFGDLNNSDVKVFAYPRHRHNKAIIDSLMAEGYRGARMGGKWDYSVNSYGDFTTPPENSWDDGISLYRIPVEVSSASLFGNHSAVPPVHKSYEEFLAVAQPRINAMRANGGIFVLFDHHLGDDNDSLGDINYGSGGVTKQDLAWMVDLVRSNGGLVLTLGEAVDYYRSRTVMTETDGDYIWMLPVSGLAGENLPTPQLQGNYPNPFNPRTRVIFSLPLSQQVEIAVFDVKGRLVRNLASRVFEAGNNHVEWDGFSNGGDMMSAGVYFVKVITPSWEDVGKMTLLK